MPARPSTSKARRLVGELREQLAERDREIERLRAENTELRAQVAALLARIADLEAKLRENSSNSSRPPSSDPPGAPRLVRKLPTGRPPGGQPGHKGTTRKLLPEEKVDEIRDHKPTRCRRCGHVLSGHDPAPLRHQHVEIPHPKPRVTEERLHALACPCCGEVTRADLPSDVPKGAFGPRLQALASVLSGAYRLSKRNVEQILSDVFGVDIALGSIKALEDSTSEALSEPVACVADYIREQPALNVDETGWRQTPEGPKAGSQATTAPAIADGASHAPIPSPPAAPPPTGRQQRLPAMTDDNDDQRRAEERKRARAWLWVAAAPLAALFLIRRSRGAKSAKELIGEIYAGIVNSDRWCGYNWLPIWRRQLCWAHLKRDFKKIAERCGEARRIGEALGACAKELFELWYRVWDGTLKRSSFRTYVSPIRARVRNLLQEGAALSDSKVSGMCSEILKLEPALWTFVRVPGVEPTNNRAERAIRPAVIWRKTSFGTQAAAGSTFVGRMLTAVATLRLQGRNVLEYMTEACSAAMEGRPAPSLLPPAPSAVIQVALAANLPDDEAA